MSIPKGLLALLSTEPKYGYQLKTDFEAATGEAWQLNVGQVYTTLDRLVRDGFVVTADEVDHGDQKQYRLTEDGWAHLGAWWRAEPTEDPLPRDELIVKVLLAISTAPDEAISVITSHRTALIEILQRRRRTQRASADQGASIVHQLAEDALVVRAEADLRWLDLCESRLHATAPKTSPKSKPTTEQTDPPDSEPASAGRSPRRRGTRR